MNKKHRQVVGKQYFLTPGDKESHRGSASLWYQVCEGKEQIFLRLFSDTAERVGGNIESKRSASPYHHTAPYTSPGKQTASQMHRFLSWNIKREE